MRFFPLEKLIRLHDGYTRRFKIDHLQLLLVQRGGEHFLLEADCPHRGHPLEEAHIADGQICCPRHNYCFSLHDGNLQQATGERCRQLRVHALVYAGNEVGVMLED